MKADILSQTPHKLRRLQARLNRLALQYARLRLMERKEDTRKKIQLGGLVKKSGLDNETIAVVYGFLLEVAEKLVSQEADDFRKAWRLKGDIALRSE
jgi:hypothetical protein